MFFLPVDGTLQFSDAFMCTAAPSSHEIHGGCPCTVWGCLLLWAVLGALDFCNMVYGKYNTDELCAVKDWGRVDGDQ